LGFDMFIAGVRFSWGSNHAHSKPQGVCTISARTGPSRTGETQKKS
jgi:hypothetical protein